MGLEILIGIGGVIIGGVLAYVASRPKAKIIEQTAQKEAERILKNAELDAERNLSSGRKTVDQMKENVRREETQMRERLEKLQDQADNRAIKREEMLDQKIEKAEKAREDFEATKKNLEKKTENLEIAISEQKEKLSEIANLSKDAAEEILLERLEKDIAPKLDETRQRRLDLMRQTADEEASNIIVQSIQRYSSPVTNESTISVVKLDSDDLKGKIIGREGRNINAFEMVTGVDLIVDDTPGTITISCFDMFRRYVAKVALENLIKDGRIHPSSIEEAVKKAQMAADKLILEIGQRACYDMGVSGFPEQVLKLIGRLRFRTSYGQNVLQHSIEVAYIAEALAGYLPGVDAEVCKKAGLVHDIGKAVSHEVEGGHAVIGADILRKFGVDEKIILAMQSHHEDFPYETIESRVLQAADAISASRPGARRETMEKYIKRIKELENIATNFEGVNKAFAIQAGREVRVFVNASKVDDKMSQKISFDLARKIEENCEYPGEVRVAVIRENRFENVAK